MSKTPQPSDGSLLSGIAGPDDLKKIPFEELPRLAEEIRARILGVTSVNGGHVGPNLGVVELTLALHRTFTTPKDKFVFDVSHQGYVHKLLTGRQDPRFDRIRKSGGYSGFLTREESPHDIWGAGHAGTALSAALGLATARDHLGSKEHVVAVIGDAALTCGITMEALNNITANTNRLIVVLNDNEWSIDKNVGAMASYLNELITNPVYNRVHHDLESFLKHLPGGESLRRMGSRTKQSAKNFFVPSCIFEKYGLRYLGPFDGHDLELLHKNLHFAKKSDQPIVVHVLTKKGKGYDAALDHPERFHGTSAFDLSTGRGKSSKTNPAPAYQDVFGGAMVRFAREMPTLAGITAAMPGGTGLAPLRDEFPSQYFDVGIAEEHAVLFAGGLAARGMHPVCAIYSTFLQRAYDPIIHDICLQNLPVTFALDRAGVSPNDGATHHGLFDIAYLRCVPNATLMQPKDEDELVDMLYTSIHTPTPTFLRYPRGPARGVPVKKRPARLKLGKAEVLRDGSDIVIWALGPMTADALTAADRISGEAGITVGVVNARFAKPIDVTLLKQHAGEASLIVTLEDHALSGGFGSAVLEELSEAHATIPVERIGWPDRFVSHGSSAEELREANGLSPDRIFEKILNRWRALKKAPNHSELLYK